jgi:glutathione S-transferase
VASRLTLADIALYAYARVADEGGFDLGCYPAVTVWPARAAAPPDHIAMDA